MDTLVEMIGKLLLFQLLSSIMAYYMPECDTPIRPLIKKCLFRVYRLTLIFWTQP